MRFVGYRTGSNGLLRNVPHSCVLLGHWQYWVVLLVIVTFCCVMAVVDRCCLLGFAVFCYGIGSKGSFSFGEEGSGVLRIGSSGLDRSAGRCEECLGWLSHGSIGTQRFV